MSCKISKISLREGTQLYRNLLEIVERHPTRPSHDISWCVYVEHAVHVTSWWFFFVQYLFLFFLLFSPWWADASSVLDKKRYWCWWINVTPKCLSQPPELSTALKMVRFTTLKHTFFCGNCYFFKSRMLNSSIKWLSLQVRSDAFVRQLFFKKYFYFLLLLSVAALFWHRYKLHQILDDVSMLFLDLVIFVNCFLYFQI